MYSNGSNSALANKIAAIKPTYPNTCNHFGRFRKTVSSLRPFSFSISAIKINRKKVNESPKTNWFAIFKEMDEGSVFKSKR